MPQKKTKQDDTMELLSYLQRNIPDMSKEKENDQTEKEFDEESDEEVALLTRKRPPRRIYT